MYMIRHHLFLKCLRIQQTHQPSRENSRLQAIEIHYENTQSLPTHLNHGTLHCVVFTLEPNSSLITVLLGMCWRLLPSRRTQVTILFQCLMPCLPSPTPHLSNSPCRAVPCHAMPCPLCFAFLRKNPSQDSQKMDTQVQDSRSTTVFQFRPILFNFRNLFFLILNLLCRIARPNFFKKNI